MTPFTTLTAVAAPLPLANVDTDRLIPVRFLRKPRSQTESYARWLFHDMRFDAEGRERSQFVLNQPPWRNAGILVAGPNFGCGSSREGAAYALLDYGIRCVIAPSFGDIHYANELQNGMLPAIVTDADGERLLALLQARPGASLTVALEPQTIAAPDGTVYRFDIDPVYKNRLLEGLDDVDLVLQHEAAIEAFERRHHGEQPWLA
jgi:3-isopropylmalate/(R)-2-methylmalate dehydratase small subunit